MCCQPFFWLDSPILVSFFVTDTVSDSGPEVEQLTGGEVAEAGRVQEIGDPETKIDPNPVRNFAKPLSLLQSETS